jgi:hypothetical protein
VTIATRPSSLPRMPASAALRPGQSTHPGVDRNLSALLVT